MSGLARDYFYGVDLRGRLWHDGTELTDPRFLDFFFRRLRANDTGEHGDHRFLSPCAGERNFVRAEDTPIVFHSLTDDGRLRYAASLQVTFDPHELRRSVDGRLYHAAPVGELGLLQSSLSLSLMDALQETEDGGYALHWRGRTATIPLLHRGR